VFLVFTASKFSVRYSSIPLIERYMEKRLFKLTYREELNDFGFNEKMVTELVLN